jgi:ribosomal protein S18 acetylase RimI-like enzyme
MIENPDFDPSLWFLAMDGDTIAGISLCYPKVTEDPEKAWVAELGVRRAWRRHGLALALLQHSFGEFYRSGKRRGGLAVDSQNLTGATRLYERAGMRVIRQFDRYEKEIRPGIELSVQTLSE